MAEIESRLAELERRLESNWSNEVLAEIRQVVSLYEEVSLREICFLGREARARQYGEGERAGRTLASLLRKPWASDYVSEVMDGGGESVAGSGGIMQVFTDFYAGLYAAPAGAGLTDAQMTFEDIALIWFDEAETPQEVTTPAARIAGSEQGKRDSDEVWRQRRSKDGAEQGALSVFVYCRDQALSVSVRRALSVSVYRRDSRIE
ncbi:hypothetical protein NDU88_002769 [Pleurodeles waltl]|uniref:Uncharacterized protein n=1 Tax=Pleurodeles waltl TaxID=8319 RepID=A0AAV7T360_PLEWA|nr:hypothetical protein NDU88_002769 [Pleurodeles waltl]